MKTILLILICAISCSGQESDSFNLRVGVQGSTYGIYINYGMELIIQVDEHFAFKPRIDYLHKPYIQENPFQNSHFRTVPINVSYSTKKMGYSFSSGTILPVPKISNRDDWGYLPYMSFQVERQHYLFRQITSYLFLDMYRSYSPIVKVGVYCRIK